MSPGRYRAQAGFSLIEVLAVLVLTGILVTIMTQLTGQWLGGWDRGARNLNRVEALSVAAARMTEDIESAMALPAPGVPPRGALRGSPDEIRFVHPGDPAGSGLEVVQYAFAADGTLVRRRGAFDARASVDQIAVGDPVAVISGRPFVAFGYLDEKGSWQTGWTGVALPAAVRITMRMGERASADDVVTVVGLHASLPVLCARAQSYAICQAMADGRTAGVPLVDRSAPRDPGQRVGVPP